MNTFEHGKMLIAMPRMTAFLDEAQSHIFDVASITKIVVDLLPALQYLHSNGVAHMDIKPANIGLDPQGNHLLIDLGSAVAFGELTPVTKEFLPSDAGNGDYNISDPQWDFWGLGVMLGKLRGSTRAGRPTKEQVFQFLVDMRIGKMEDFLLELQKTLPETK